MSYRNSVKRNPYSFDDVIREQDMDDIKETLTKWTDAMMGGDPEQVTALYADDATFWGTVATQMASTKAQVRAYFESFLQKDNLNIYDVIGEIQVEGDRAIYAGYYTFSFEENGKKSVVPARLTFMYRKNDDGDWLIIHHHSSVMPAQSNTPKP